MLPEPTLSFTLPSIHDNTTLECRVFHPYSLSPSPKAPPWRQLAAIIAHPYAPLGGCNDDHVVNAAGSTLLRLGFLVGTFNFRGAGGSTGRTSWTSKPECSDYMTFAGFMAYYMHHIDPFSPEPSPSSAGHTDGGVNPVATAAAPDPGGIGTPDVPILLLGGYSYGAMIVTQLPPLSAILANFAKPDAGSSAAEVRLRAQHLAEKENTVLKSARLAALERARSSRKSGGAGAGLSVRVGGDEDGAHRRSHDSRRSVSLEAEERIRRGVGDLMGRMKRPGSRSRMREDKEPRSLTATAGGHDGSADAPESPALAVQDIHLQIPRVAYLLISPPQGSVRTFLSASLSNPFSRKAKGPSARGREADPASALATTTAAAATATAPAQEPADLDGEGEIFADNPTLAVYGDEDGFMAAKKQRQWAKRLESLPRSRFRAHEVSSAGHFWVEIGVLDILQGAVKSFGEDLIRGSAWRDEGTTPK